MRVALLNAGHADDVAVGFAPIGGNECADVWQELRPDLDAEATVGLAIVIAIYRNRKTPLVDEYDAMRR